MRPFSFSNKFKNCVSAVVLALSLAVVSAQSDMPLLDMVSAKAKQGQLGITVSKPSAAMYAQLPKLPRGCGFLLLSVAAEGAADVAGLRPMDVIWKFGDQLLVNESQMMVLLSHYSEGDKVEVSFFHSGKAKRVVLEFQKEGLRPADQGVLADVPPFPSMSSLPMRVISYEDRSASISDSSGMATLTFREGKPWLRVESRQGEEVYNGSVDAASDIARVPVNWRGRLPILRRSLEESIRLRRLPRVRRVPTPRVRIAGAGSESE